MINVFSETSRQDRKDLTLFCVLRVEGRKAAVNRRAFGDVKVVKAVYKISFLKIAKAKHADVRNSPSPKGRFFFIQCFATSTEHLIRVPDLTDRRNGAEKYKFWK